jgi:RimJ/RimL family protein N-acetyltransferase
MSDVSINTIRLRLRRWRAEDIEPFAAMCGDPDVMRHIGSGAIQTHEQASRSIHEFEREWEDKGYGLFAVEKRDTEEFIGFAGLSEPNFLPEIMPAVEIGWRFVRQYWGNGYATEAARAALDFGLQQLGIREIVSIYQSENHASRRIIEKLEMQFDRETLDPSCGRLVQVYRTAAT